MRPAIGRLPCFSETGGSALRRASTGAGGDAITLDVENPLTPAPAPIPTPAAVACDAGVPMWPESSRLAAMLAAMSSPCVGGCWLDPEAGPPPRPEVRRGAGRLVESSSLDSAPRARDGEPRFRPEAALAERDGLARDGAAAGTEARCENRLRAGSVPDADIPERSRVPEVTPPEGLACKSLGLATGTMEPRTSYIACTTQSTCAREPRHVLPLTVFQLAGKVVETRQSSSGVAATPLAAESRQSRDHRAANPQQTASIRYHLRLDENEPLTSVASLASCPSLRSEL